MELTDKEKAKAYDNVVSKLRKFMQQGVNPLITSNDVQDFFPELKESEDEMIVEVLLNYFKDYKTQEEIGIKTFNGIPTDDIIDWLEKQGEKKPAEWSDEDEAFLMAAIKTCLENYGQHSEIAIWLKSLKQRYIWKPSKEQVVALRWVLNNIPYNKHKEEISGLIDQIKDL